MKISKTVFLLIAFCICLCSFLVTNVNAQEDDNLKIFEKYFKELGLDKTDDMTKENFKFLLEKLLFDMLAQNFPNHSNFYKKIVEKSSLLVPDVFPKNQFMEYLNQEKISAILIETIREDYGEEYLEKIQSELEKHQNEDKNETTEEDTNEEGSSNQEIENDF